ncbi:DUF6542 domain-containing protein [Kitasatospora sp. SUK 42]|uniref:DUF6542 domain-containing protein n=1 Tax=Kitasatospora sp. SUK 42 TaxID=1588882 RepID=UPI0018CB0F43|nr:DUF6542 domain-containing protein [Kitasatospora sp. SUK 42]MBV2152386.1 hypothetical protein [Kitasatospora sp. SUK 42]
MAGQRGRSSDQGSRRRAAPGRPDGPTRPFSGGPALPAAVAVGLPLVGAGIDELSGSGMGLAFAVCAVLGTGLAAALSTRSGWWWVVAASPLVVLGITAVAELVANSDLYQGNRLATGSAKWVVHGFPVMAQAAAAALLVIVVRVVRDRRRHHG